MILGAQGLRIGKRGSSPPWAPSGWRSRSTSSTTAPARPSRSRSTNDPLHIIDKQTGERLTIAQTPDANAPQPRRGSRKLTR